jgi:NADH-quinone oxidoreductase subunit E
VNTFKKIHASEIERLLANYPPDRKQAAVMPLLHLAQQEAGYISEEAMREIGEICEISTTEVASIVGYYTMFHAQADGKIRLMVCTDVACRLRGAREYLAVLCNELGVEPGQTTGDGLVTIEEVKCIAACDHTPVFQSQINDEIEYHENQTPARTLDWLKLMTASMKPGEAPIELGRAPKEAGQAPIELGQAPKEAGQAVDHE